uniref:Patatin n=1 Tax=Pyramimonas obovata TaxID=1411642 RepID=A0A7S0RG70_9CHLO|mmetsp:Transcript_33596/g.73327  ORF Transcript_33596/g.73327 Transcript_33596/m.73327 type:complete len:300 (+) Transcript_33596:186-1085(+)|eukprot:CAMPEP_0118945604 /NCGR_PEP_ID=MMETSP1169-20130426/42601_1 /TAXON_ID=36882 /ORGANISM="Pyramimonas obovata, Strain CCMP722" /LENGTH=299 /DNA_ID=CAMNT_0006891357 /DNA_START=70 /DNA_END=969 /DNA_ORIENTATION=-
MVPGISFAGCGFMYPYYFGVTKYVSEHFDTSKLSVAGISSGCTAAASLACGVTEMEHWKAFQQARKLWLRRLLGPFMIATKNWIEPYLPTFEAHEKELLTASREGRLTLGVTAISLRKSWWPLVSRVVDTFRSAKEFVYVVTCSQRLFPFYRWPTGYIEGEYVVDGGFSKDFAKPRNVSPEELVTVAPWTKVIGADICPQKMESVWRFFIPPSRDRWERSMQAGYEDAKRLHDVFVRKGFPPISCAAKHTNDAERKADVRQATFNRNDSAAALLQAADSASSLHCLTTRSRTKAAIDAV